jgi:putative CocE/NonD family hydrolase
MFIDKLKDLRIPAFHQSGWFDGDGIGTKLNYLAMAADGHLNQKLTIGPWGHADVASRSYAGQDFGKAAVVDLQRDYVRWFAHWLKGLDNGILRESLVSIFVMGSNRWLRGPTYPLPQNRFEKVYLSTGGRLSFTAPATARTTTTTIPQTPRPNPVPPKAAPIS